MNTFTNYYHLSPNIRDTCSFCLSHCNDGGGAGMTTASANASVESPAFPVVVF
jgi:hypothetical protein